VRGLRVDKESGGGVGLGDEQVKLAKYQKLKPKRALRTAREVVAIGEQGWQENETWREASPCAVTR